MYCGNCGSNIKDNVSYCPYCGLQVGNNNGYYQNVMYNNVRYLKQGTNGMAITGFILAFIFPVLGLIFSIIGLVSSKDYYDNSGRGLSIAGIVISLIPIIFFIIIFMGLVSLSSLISY